MKNRIRIRAFPSDAVTDRKMLKGAGVLRDWFSLFVKFPFPVSTAIVLDCYYHGGTLLVDKKTSVSLQLVIGLRLLYPADNCLRDVLTMLVDEMSA